MVAFQAEHVCLVTDLLPAGHMKIHTAAAVAECSLQQLVLPECNCYQQQQVGHMIHNSVAHSSAEK